SGKTVNDGVFSWWKGQSPTRLRPRRRNGTYVCTRSTRSTRSLTCSFASWNRSIVVPVIPTRVAAPRPKVTLRRVRDRTRRPEARVRLRDDALGSTGSLLLRSATSADGDDDRAGHSVLVPESRLRHLANRASLAFRSVGCKHARGPPAGGEQREQLAAAELPRPPGARPVVGREAESELGLGA